MRIAIIRLSSMGDILLTTPILKAIKESFPDASIDFFIKKKYLEIIKENQEINKIYALENKKGENIKNLLNQVANKKYDYVFDLHKNYRSKRISKGLKGAIYRYDKESIARKLFLLTGLNFLKETHVVDRYFRTIEVLGIPTGDHGIAQIKPTESEKIKGHLARFNDKDFIVWAIGGKHFTKRLPSNTIIKVIDELNMPFVLVGDSSDQILSSKILNSVKAQNRVIDLTGKTSISQSAWLIQKSALIISNDSFIMHLASAFPKPLLTLWGSTRPELGFSAYKKNAFVLQAKVHFIYRFFYVFIPRKWWDKESKCMHRISNTLLTNTILSILDKPNSNR